MEHNIIIQLYNKEFQNDLSLSLVKQGYEVMFLKDKNIILFKGMEDEINNGYYEIQILDEAYTDLLIVSLLNQNLSVFFRETDNVVAFEINEDFFIKEQEDIKH
jgi:hypothetical protein